MSPPPTPDPDPPESVWTYPRPPRIAPSDRRVEVWFGGRRVACSRRAVRVLETSHPPTWYVPRADVAPGVLVPGGPSTLCEYKGRALHLDLVVGDARSAAAAWTYPHPAPGYEALADRVAFYPARVDACLVDGEPVRPQPGDFYGGWITRDVRGPFKGGPGTAGW